MPAFDSVSHIALTVTNLEASRDWYAKVLGWQGMFDGEESGMRYSLGAYPNVNVFMTLREHDASSGGAFDETRAGLDHLAFGVGSRAELEEWEKKFDEAGVKYTPIIDAPYGHVLNFRDPDNIALELFANPGT